MNQMINEKVLKTMIENEILYEDNLDEYGHQCIGPEDVRDEDLCIEMCMSFWICGPMIKGLRKCIMRIEDHDILFWEMVSIVRTMDREALASHIESEMDRLSYDPWREHCDADFYGV